MASKGSILPRLTQAVERCHFVCTIIKLHGYKVKKVLPGKNSTSKVKTCLNIDGELFYVCLPLFKIEDEASIWKLKLQEYDETKELTELEKDSVSLGDIRIQIGKARKISITGDPDGSQLRQMCQRGMIEDIKRIAQNCKCCNLVLNLCDVPYSRPEDLCDRRFSNSLSEIRNLKKVLVVHPKPNASICGMESGLEGTWSRYLATDMVCLQWKSDESYFRKFEKKYLKQVVRNGMHDIKKKSATKPPATKLKKGKRATEAPSESPNVQEKAASPLAQEMWSHPVFRGISITLILLAFYFLSSEILVTLLLISASVWFKYGSKKPEFKKYTRSGDPRVLAFRGIYQKEIEKLRYARDMKRMRLVHGKLKESVLNAYAVTRVSTGDSIGVEDHEELERELELTFKEFVTENDVKMLLHEAHYTSFVLAFTVFLYMTSRFVYQTLGRVWRPVHTVAVILSVILLCFALYVVSTFFSTSVLSARLIGAVEILSLIFGLWLVTDVTGVLIEIRACIDHVTRVIWREVELETCIVKSPSYLAVKLALDCFVLLALFPLVYYASGILSIFAVSSVIMDSVAVYFPPGVFLLQLCARLAFFGRVLRFVNLLMCVSLASKFYGLHKKRDDPLDAQLYSRLGYCVGSVTEYMWKPMVEYLNPDLQ